MSGYRHWAVIAVLFFVSTGCGQKSDSSKSDVQLPAWMSAEESKETTSIPIRLASNTPSAHLGLNLKPGDQFPLRKIVQQELTQNAPHGEPQQNYSRLEMLLAVTVKEKRDERIRLSVRYDRIRYEHQIADEQVRFDSSTAGPNLTTNVVAYRDMINDGFSFWIGPDNQIVEVEGLSEFLDRALRNVPPDQRQDVVLGMEAGSGDSGIANFVDNTIGLLPYKKKTAPGDTWDRQQQVSRPLPMVINNLFTLKELTDSYAVIDIRGTIAPSTTLRHQGSPDVQLFVNGGSTLGSCTIYRDTGLPKESRIDRVVEMTVVMPNSVQFRQTKRMTTTIESFPQASMGVPKIVGGNQPGSIQQVSGTK